MIPNLSDREKRKILEDQKNKIWNAFHPAFREAYEVVSLTEVKSNISKLKDVNLSALSPEELKLHIEKLEQEKAKISRLLEEILVLLKIWNEFQMDPKLIQLDSLKKYLLDDTTKSEEFLKSLQQYKPLRNELYPNRRIENDTFRMDTRLAEINEADLRTDILIQKAKKQYKQITTADIEHPPITTAYSDYNSKKGKVDNSGKKDTRKMKKK